MSLLLLFLGGVPMRYSYNPSTVTALTLSYAPDSASAVTLSYSPDSTSAPVYDYTQHGEDT